MLLVNGRGRIRDDALLGCRRIHWSLTGSKHLRRAGRRAQRCSEASCICLEVIETDLSSAATGWREVVVYTQRNGFRCRGCLQVVVVGHCAAARRRWWRPVVFFWYGRQQIFQSWHRVFVLDLHGGELCHCLIQR